MEEANVIEERVRKEAVRLEQTRWRRNENLGKHDVRAVSVAVTGSVSKVKARLSTSRESEGMAVKEVSPVVQIGPRRWKVVKASALCTWRDW